jgi:hypothetical protein
MQLMRSSESLERYIKLGWMSSNVPNGFKQKVDGVRWYPDYDTANAALTLQGLDFGHVIPIGGCPGLGHDLITSIIFDDCTDCFEWFSEILPPIHMSCFNEGGWSFLSLALHAKAEKLLHRFFLSGFPRKPCSFIIDSAHALGAGPSVIGISASSMDHQSFTKLFKQLEEGLNGRGFNETLRYALTHMELAAIRCVAPPYLLEMLYEAGLICLHPVRHSRYCSGMCTEMDYSS